jgi:hypothetical protein
VADTLLGSIFALAIAVPSPVSVSLSIGSLIALAILPVTLRTLWLSTRGKWLLITILGLVPSGWLTAQGSLLRDTGRTFDTRWFLYESAIPLGLAASIVGAHWCIAKLGLERFLQLSMTGLLLAVPLTDHRVEDNLWKYSLAIPISILSILFLAKSQLLLGLIVVPALAVVAISAEYRSWIALLVLTTLLTILPGHRLPRPSVLPGNRQPRPSTSRLTLIGIATIAATIIISWLSVRMATGGALGSVVQERTLRQLEVSDGNLLFGARPGWNAAITLWQQDPLGIGIGVAPSANDYWLAEQSMPPHVSRQDPSFFLNLFIQGKVDFHSTLWTFWGTYGVVGALFAVFALVYCTYAIVVSITAKRKTHLQAAIVLLLLSSTWDILFSPTNVTVLAIGLATAIHIIDRSDPRIDYIGSAPDEEPAIH